MDLNLANPTTAIEWTLCIYTAIAAALAFVVIVVGGIITGMFWDKNEDDRRLVWRLAMLIPFWPLIAVFYAIKGIIWVWFPSKKDS